MAEDEEEEQEIADQSLSNDEWLAKNRSLSDDKAPPSLRHVAEFTPSLRHALSVTE